MANIKNPGPVAQRLKALRLEHGWTLDDVAERSGISKATLSKLENGHTNLSFASVTKLSNGLGIPFSVLTNPPGPGEGARRSVTRGQTATVFEARDARWQVLCNDLAGQDQVYLRSTILSHELAESAPWRRHPGQEFIHVLSGVLLLYSEAYEPLELSSGDSIAFDSSMGHKYVSASVEDAEILIIMQASGYTDADEWPG